MVKQVLIKRAKDGVDREELITYLKEIHGPRIAQLPQIESYTLAVQVDPAEVDLPEGIEYYDPSETIPVNPDETRYDTIEIHEYETIDDLLEAHSLDQSGSPEDGLHNLIEFEDEIAFVVREEPISL